jgi:hypothetical protein
MLRCMPWWDAYYQERLALGDRKTPDLDGFHYLLRGIELPKVGYDVADAAGPACAMLGCPTCFLGKLIALQKPGTWLAARSVCVEASRVDAPAPAPFAVNPRPQLYRAGWTGNYQAQLQGLSFGDWRNHAWNLRARPKLAALGLAQRWDPARDQS